MDWQLLLLAFEAALYPTLIAAVVILMEQPRRLPLLAAYLAGGLTISIGLGCALVFAAQGALEKQGSQSTLSWTADLAIGGLALLLAVALATRSDERVRRRREARRAVKHPEKTRPEPGDDDGKEPWSQRILSGGSAPIVFLAGLAINVPGAAYLIGLKDIAAGHHSTGGAIGLILVFNAIMFLMAEVPLAGLAFAPERTEELVLRFNAWLSRNGRTIAMVLCAILGVFLVVRGISNS